MQFKHPELLYALFLLLIPIIVHLFQLRKFQKEQFTNVAFLKEVVLKTRKSSQLKKWLTLLTRLLLLAAVILAFAQPFTSKHKSFNVEKETVIYLDNSFSMQSQGTQGELLKRAVQDIINQENDAEELTILTNSEVYKNTTIKGIKNELLQLDYASNQLSYDAALLKAKKQFRPNSNSIKNLVFISDFQQKNNVFSPEVDATFKINAVALKPVNTNNISIDSIYISKQTATQIELTVTLNSNGEVIENLPVSLLNNNQLIAKSSISFPDNTQAVFTVNSDDLINGTLQIDDPHLQFDNRLFFSINRNSKINVLSINDTDDSFLRKIYAKTEFNYVSTPLDRLNYNLIENQNLIILNELKSIPNSLATALGSFIANGGYIAIIPSIDTSIPTYNTFLNTYGIDIQNKVETEKRITTINYSHPIFENVFDKKVKNFQYPRVNSFFNINSASASLLKFEDNKPFLVQRSNVFVFAASISDKNSNFKSSPLIVPTIYNIGKQSLKTSKLYYTIGNTNSYDIATSLQQNDILTLKMDAINVIPQQQYFNNKIALTTSEIPSIAGIYNVVNKSQVLENISYNYNRSESVLAYQDLSGLSNISVYDSVEDLFTALKSDSKVNELWKWFVIFALVFLIIEMLILKYLK